MKKANGKAPAHEHAEHTISDNEYEFAQTLEAAEAYRDAEHRNWECAWVFGDVLVQQCGVPGADGVHTGSDARIARAAKFLRQHGIEYSNEHLRDLRQVANAFPAGDRSPAVAWSVYRVAGNLEIFNGAKTSARIAAKKLTVPFIKKYRKRLNLDKKRADQQQQEDADPGNGPRPDPARVSAEQTLLDNTAQARELGIAIKKALKEYPLLTRKELDALDEVLDVYYRVVQKHEEEDDLRRGR